MDAFREACGQAQDATTSLDYYLPWTRIWRARPVLAMVFRRNRLLGMVLSHLRRSSGLATGIAKAGNGAGQGGVIGQPEDWCEIMEAAASAFLKLSSTHTVLFSAAWPGQPASPPGRPQGSTLTRWQFRTTNCRLALAGGYDATMERLGYKMRRNLRYYRRRAEAELGCRFVPDLGSSERQEAVTSLRGRSRFALSARRVAALDAVLVTVPGHFAMGLQTEGGEWVSCLVGWRTGPTTYVYTQFNDSSHGKLSLSTVMRSHLLEHEAARGCQDIVFVGGTTDQWSRVCEPSVCGDLLAVREGVLGTLTRRLTLLLRPHGELAALHRAYLQQNQASPSPVCEAEQQAAAPP